MMMIKSLNIDPIVACCIFVDLRLLPLYVIFFSINDCILYILNVTLIMKRVLL